MLHNFKWGQVSVVLTLLVFLSLWLAARGYKVAAGVMLAVAITVKYYPAIFLLHFAIRREWKTIVTTVAAVAAFFIATAAVLGLEQTLRFSSSVNEALRVEQRWIPTDSNSQYAAYVGGRWLDGCGGSGVTRTMTWAGYAVSVTNVGLFWFAHRRRKSNPDRWAALLLFPTILLWVPTSWPHYFVYLPALQLLAVHDLSAEPRTRASRWVAGGFLAASIALACSPVLIHLAMNWIAYSASGCLFASNACLVLYCYLRVASATGSSTNGAS